LKLTSAYYYLPSGRNIQKKPDAKDWGVDPTDGYYVPISSTQAEALQGNQREREKLGLAQPKQVPQLTPKSIEEDYGDRQLAAALKAMQAKVDNGEFVKTGEPIASLQAHVLQRERLEKIRETLRKNLEEVNKELAELEKAGTQEKK